MESLPSPSAVLAKPNLTVLEAGALLHRVHDRELAPNAFNPCLGGPTRFAPIRDSDGRCVPSLYAGGTLVSAIYETVFHDVPAEAERKTVPRYQIDRRSYGTLQLRRAIRLANQRALCRYVARPIIPQPLAIHGGISGPPLRAVSSLTEP